MGIQLTSEFDSHNGSAYDIEIYNESFAGSSKAVTTNDLRITYESEGDQILESLKASRCSFTLVNDSAEVDTFIDNLVAGNEDQFKMVVRKQNKMEWCGVILIDQVSWEDMPKPRLLNITAIDGIGRLADIEFDFATTDGNPAQSTMLDYIYEALEYNDLSQYWGASAAYFKESCEFYDTQMNNTGTQYSPLLQTRCDRYLFVTDTVIGERTITGGTGMGKGTSITLPKYRPLTCAEVIDSILKIFCCRMFMIGGSYYIQQVRNFSTSSYMERSISKSLSVLSFQTRSPRKTEGVEYTRLGDCLWTYLTPLREVRLDSVPLVAIATGGDDITNMTYALSPLSQNVNLGTLRGGTGSGKTIRIRITVFELPLNNFGGYMDIAINFTAGTYRLSSALATPDIIEWTTTATDRVYRRITNAQMYGNNDLYIDIETPEFPLASQTGCTIDIEYTAVIPNTTWRSFWSVDIRPPVITILTDGKIVQESQFQVINQRTQNSKNIDYGRPLLTDITQDFSSKNTFEVNSTGATWVASGEWAAGYTTDVELVKTLCLETMSLQDRPVKVLQGTIKVPISLVGVVPHIPRFNEVYYYESDSYYYNGGTFDCIRDEFSGEWIQFTQNKAGLSIEQEDGDGYVYKGNDKFGTPKKNGDDKDKWTRDFALINELGTIDTDSSGVVTSISIDALGKAVFNGDNLAILHPVNLRTVATVVVDGNQPTPATAITIDSQDIDVSVGYIVVQKMNDIIETEKGRFEQLVTSNTTPPTSGGFGDGGNAILNPGDGFLYYTDGSQTWKITGTLVT